MEFTDTLQLTREAGVVTVTIDRPEKKNALSLVMFRDLGRIITSVERNPDDRVLVITGAGGNFCAGADLTAVGVEVPDATGEESHEARARALMREDIEPTVIALHRMSKPSIAAVAGVAAGAGANLALGCDLILAAADARFSQIFVRRALSLDFGGSWLLPRLVGMHKAKELAFLGDWLGAEEARDLGIVSRVYAPDELVAGTRSWAERLAGQPPLAVSLIKKSLHRAFDLTFEEAVAKEFTDQSTCASSEDFMEGVGAFLEKRKPHFSGR